MVQTPANIDGAWIGVEATDRFSDELVERLLWPDLIIIGGGASKKSDKFLPHVALRTDLLSAGLSVRPDTDGLTAEYGSTIVVASLHDHDVFPLDQVDQPVLVVDAARPTACERVTELLRLADPSERITGYLVEETIDALECRPVRSLPEDVVLPPVGCEDEPHRSS